MGCSLLDRLDANYLRDSVLELPLDSHLEGDAARRAADAGPMETDQDGPVVSHVHKLEIAAVGLDCGTDQVENRLDPFAQRHVVGLGELRI